MNEHEFEDSPGLPGRLPPGERIVWQGSPNWRTLARSAFKTRWIAFYFALLALGGAAVGEMAGALLTVVAGTVCIGVLSAIAWGTAKSTIYTITNRRVVIRAGLAVPIAINLPLAQIGAADLHALGRGHGDIALTTTGSTKLAYWMLWPHARPWRLSQPQPMLRALDEVEKVGALLSSAASAAAPIERRWRVFANDDAPASIAAAGSFA